MHSACKVATDLAATLGCRSSARSTNPSIRPYCAPWGGPLGVVVCSLGVLAGKVESMLRIAVLSFVLWLAILGMAVLARAAHSVFRHDYTATSRGSWRP